MPPVENQPPKPNQQGAEFGLEPPQLYGFTGDGNALPDPYQFTGDGQEVKSGPQIYLGPAGQDWGPRIGPSEKRIDQMPEGPQKDAALARETNVLFNVPVALKAYRDDIKAADAIDQTDVARRNTANVALLRENQTQLAQAKATNASPEQMNALLGKQQELQNAQKLIVGDYYAPATTRINAGLALITTGQDMLVDYGQNLITEALKLRPELRDNPLFNKNLEAARRECIKNRESAFSGEMKDPYQWSGDGSVPGGIPQKRPGIPGQPGRGADGRPLPDSNPGFTPIPGYDAPPQQQAQPFPQFKRGGETPDNARKDKPQQKPKEDFTPPAQPPKEKGVDKSVWEQMNDGQKLFAAALAAFLGYKLVQRGSRILAERSRDAGNEALGKTPENAAKLKEAIERAGKEFARDNVVKAKLVKEGEHTGKYEVTRPDGKKEFMSETDFKDKYSETGKPGEYKSWLSDRTKAVQLPDLKELNEELGLGKQADRKMWAVEENGEVKLLTDKEFKQGWRSPTDADKASWQMEAERNLTPEQKTEKAAADKAAADKAAAEKAAAEKAAAEKAAAEKAAAEKAAAEKAAAEKAAAEKVAAEKAAAEKAAADKAAEEKAAAEKAAAEKAALEKAAADKAAADKAAEEKAAAEKAAADKAAAEKAAAEKAAAEKAAADKAAADKAAEEKAAAEKAAADKAAAEKAAAEKAAAEKAAADKAAEEKAAAEKAAAEKAAAEKAALEKAAAEKAAAEKAAAEKVAAEKAAAEKAAAEKAAAEKAAADKAAAEKAAAEKAAAEKAALEKAAADKAAADKAAEEKAAAEKAAAEKAAAEKVAAEKAAAEKAAAEKAAAEKAAAEKAALEKAAAEKAAAEKAAAEKAAAEKVAAEKAALEKAAADKAAADKAAAEKAAADKAAAEKAAADKAAAEKAAADKAAAEKAAADKAAAEKAAADKAAAEKAAAEKAAAEKAAAEKAALEKAAAEKAAADKLASEGRFKPAPGSEIIAGIKVDQTATVDGVTWKAVGKTEDKIVFKNETGITRSETPLKFEAKDFNRVELSGEKGIFFQRKGSNTMYQYFPLDGKQALEPGAGNGFLFKLDGVEARPLGSPIVRAMLNPAAPTGAAPLEGPKTEAKPEEGPRKPRRGAAPSADRISGVDYTPAPDGTMKRTPEVVGKRLIGTDATARELLVADEVKMLESRVEELEKKAKDNKIEAKEKVELAAHRYVLENLHRPEVHKGLIEKMASSRPAAGFRLGEVRSAGVGVAILATAALALYISSQPQGQYTAPERARIGG
jgi:hypothetical protein